VVVLAGALGAGKTVFAKGVALGLGIPEEQLASPSFVIAAEFPSACATGPARLVHADAYRVVHAEELEAAGLFDWLAPGCLLLLEWGDRFPESLPADRLDVHLSVGAAPEQRRVEARAGGPASRALLEAWIQRCP
jgi:tRNA threonylcarbamoyladenosine biosynthesis protein TsaE